jgi:hypothetical protein
VGILVVQQAHGVLCKLGLTSKHQQIANPGFGSGWTFFNLAFSCYLQLQFSNWASVAGGRFSTSPTTPSPER